MPYTPLAFKDPIPLVERDLKDAKVVALEDWVEAVFNISKAQLGKWTSKIGELKWFEDEIIQQCLADYCKEKWEWERHEPFTKLANRIITLARGNLPNVPKVRSYPIDIRVETVDQPIERILHEDGSFSSAREPQVLVTHGAASKRLSETGTMLWADVLHWFEVVSNHGNLIPLLNAERSSRAMHPLDPDTGLAITVRRSNRKTSKTKRFVSTEHSGTARRPKPDPTIAPTAVKAGTKRPSEDDDDSSKKKLEHNEHKYDIYTAKLDAPQTGAYALELLSCTYGTRLFCHGTVIRDDRLSLWYYDASGIMYTKQYLSLIRDFEKAAAIIVGMARCNAEQFGALPASIIKPPIPYPKSFPPENLKGSGRQLRHPVSGKQVRVTLKEPLYTQWGLCCRRSFVYTATADPALSKGGLVAKFAYQACTRKAEQDLVTIAHKAGVEHLPELHMWADLLKLSDGAFRVFLENSEEKADYEDRTLRMIVYTEYISIKTLFSQRCDLIPVMVEQMVDCLHDLRYKAKILHRDISAHNIMYEMRGDNYHFVLIDFDTAIVLKDDDSPYVWSSKHRTASPVFMARELLLEAWRYTEDPSQRSEIANLLRHDYESLFYVSVWSVCTLLAHTLSYDDGADLASHVEAWQQGTFLEIAAIKNRLCFSGLEDRDVDLPAPARCLEDWFAGWQTLFSDASAAIEAHEVQERGGKKTKKTKKTDVHAEPFDEHTAGGAFSRDAIRKVLTPLMPFRQAAD